MKQKDVFDVSAQGSLVELVCRFRFTVSISLALGGEATRMAVVEQRQLSSGKLIHFVQSADSSGYRHCKLL